MLLDNFSPNFGIPGSASSDSTSIDEFAASLGNMVIWDYVAKATNRVRAGRITATWNAANTITQSDQTTDDLDNLETDDLEFTVSYVAGNIVLASSATYTYTITFRRTVI
jgi:hypothetical protein